MTPGKGEGSAEVDAAAAERLGEVAPLVREAAELWQSGRTREALATHLRAAEILAEVLPGSEELFIVLTSLGRSATEAGLYRAAVEAFAEAAGVARRAYGDESIEVAQCLLEGGTATFYRGDEAAARAQLEDALAMLRRLLPEDNALIALALNNLSGVTEQLGDTVEAERLLGEALAIASRAGHEGGAAKYRVNIGCLRMRAGRLEAAEHFLESALEEIRAAFGEQSLEAATCLAELMKTYTAMERLDDAARVGGQSFEIRTALLPKNHPEVLDGGAALGRLHVLCGAADNGQALLGNALRGLVPLYGEDDPRSIGCYFDALHAARLATGNDYAQSYVTEALPAAVEWAETLPGEAARLWLFRGLVDLACLEAGASNAEASAAARDRAFELLRELDDLTWDVASHLDDLARLLEDAGAMRTAIRVRMRRARLDDRWLSLLAGTINPDLRDEYARRLVASTTGFLSFLLDHAPHDADGRRLAVSLILERKGAATDAAIRNDPRTLAQDDAKLAAAAARVADVQAKLDARLAEGPTDGHQKLWWELDQLHARLREETSRFAAELPLDRLLRAEPASLAAVAAALPKGSALIEFAALWRPDEVDESAPGLHDVTAERYVAIVLRADAPEDAELVDLGAGGEVERAIYTYLACLSPAERSAVPRAYADDLVLADEFSAGCALRRLVLDPLRPLLGGATRLLIAPDGAVARISFASLPEDDDPAARVIDHTTVSYLRAGHAVLEARRPETAEAGAPLVLGDPDFDWGSEPEPPEAEWGALDVPVFSFARLEGAGAEARQVAELVGGSCLLDREATQGALQAARSPRLLHLATHGFYLRRGGGLSIIGNWREFGATFRAAMLANLAEHPFARSGIVLAGVNAWSDGVDLPPDVDDGIVTAAEMARLDLRATQLVTLSACQSALGDLTLGEGAAGLVQALHIAGARTVVATLWEIPADALTETLVASFYRQLLEGCPRAEALRAAQLEQKQQALAEDQIDPWTWGAFVCYGDWRSLDEGAQARGLRTLAST